MEHKSSDTGKAIEDSGGQQPHSSSDPAPPPPVPLSIPSLSPLFYRFLLECENLFPFPRSLFAIALACVPSASVRPSFRPLARRRPLALQGRRPLSSFVELISPAAKIAACHSGIGVQLIRLTL